MNRIKELRTAQGWTQAQLGAKIGTVKSTISEYENEKHFLDPPTIHALCDLFGCTADYLLGRSESRQAVLTAEDAQLLSLYHSAPENVRAAISVLLEGVPEPVEKKKAG